MRRVVVLLAVLAACGRPVPRQPSVLLVTIDTLRADAVGAGTPAIDAFLREATRFPRARTVAPLTLVAHLSMFAGLSPTRHGIRDNATAPLPPRGARPFQLLAEQFRDAGYETAAFAASAVLGEATGVGAGFGLYDCPESEAQWAEEGGYMPAELRVRAPLAWMDGRPGPWFVWVHLFDPHMPYRAFPGDARRAATRETDSDETRYAGEVRRADAAFEKLLAAASPDTIVVLASDHGESLGEHGEPMHGALCYGATIDAVLAVRAPGFARGAEDEGLRGVADIAPTLRRLCGLEARDGDGRDLAGPPHDTLVSESLLCHGVHGWAQVFVATDGRHTLVEAGPSFELFDRESDPRETAPLGLSSPAYEKLDRALLTYRQAEGGGAGGDGDLLLTVSAYGGLRRHYAGCLPRHENTKLQNPRDHMRDWGGLEIVPALIRAGRARRDPVPLHQALRGLEEIGNRIPTSPRVDHYRASVHAALAEVTGVVERYGDAAASEIAAIGKGYVHPTTILSAIDYAVAARDAAALRALADLLRGTKLDRESERALAEGMRALGVAPEVAVTRPSVPDPSAADGAPR